MTDEELFLVYMHAALSNSQDADFAAFLADKAITEHRYRFPETREGKEGAEAD